jgi:hypothetical protein
MRTAEYDCGPNAESSGLLKGREEAVVGHGEENAVWGFGKIRESRVAGAIVEGFVARIDPENFSRIAEGEKIVEYDSPEAVGMADPHDGDASRGKKRRKILPRLRINGAMHEPSGIPNPKRAALA